MRCKRLVPLITVEDLQASVAFFVDQLGFHLPPVQATALRAAGVKQVAVPWQGPASAERRALDHRQVVKLIVFRVLVPRTLSVSSSSR